MLLDPPEAQPARTRRENRTRSVHAATAGDANTPASSDVSAAARVAAAAVVASEVLTAPAPGSRRSRRRAEGAVIRPADALSANRQTPAEPVAPSTAPVTREIAVVAPAQTADTVAPAALTAPVTFADPANTVGPAGTPASPEAPRPDRRRPATAEPATARMTDAGKTAGKKADASSSATSPAAGTDDFLAASATFRSAGRSTATGETATVTEPAEPTAHIAPPRRPRRAMRKVVTFGASVGVMGIAGLIAVSTTLPAEAVAAARGLDGKSAQTSLVATDNVTADAKGEDEIQAFVASSSVQNVPLERGDDSFGTASLIDLAAANGIAYSDSLYTNDPDAAIQWPFAVGVAMSSGYGPRWGGMHSGIDLVPGKGAPIQVIADGVVRQATEAGGDFGVTAYVDHVIDGKVVTSHYSHMLNGSLEVKTGDKVKVGDIIGKVGNTGLSYGAHLHFEIIIDGTRIDPLPWMMENAGRYEY